MLLIPARRGRDGVRVNVDNGSPWALSRPFLSVNIPVSLLGESSMPVFNPDYCQKWASHGPWAASLHLPVSLLGKVS